MVKRAGVLLTVLLSVLPMVSMAEEVLVRWGDITVTQEDVRRYLTFNLPEEDHAKAMDGNLYQYIGNILMMRELARRAREEDIGPGPEQLAWQREYQEVIWRAKAYQEQTVAEAQADMDWEAYAKEVYIAEPERFTLPDKVEAAHILIQVQDRTEEEARMLIDSLREQAMAGESFAELAKAHSEDKGSRSKGGNLGAFEASQMVPEFAEAAFALAKPGDISEVVKTQFGYHIIQLNKKIPGQKQNFEKVKPQLIENLKKTVAQQAINTLLGTLRSEAFGQEINHKAANALREEYGLEPVSEPAPVETDN